MKFQGIIFDLDGVLIHTDELHYKAWKSIADKLGAPFDRERNNLLRGVSRMESLEIVLAPLNREFTAEEKHSLAEEKNNEYRRLLSFLTKDDVTDDVRATLDSLKRSGVKIAIGSSSKNAKYILQQVELIDCFDAISDGNNITKSKPDPEVFIKAAQYLGLNPDSCLVVEDASAGIAAAKAGCFASAGIGAAALDPNADYKISSIGELINIID